MRKTSMNNEQYKYQNSWHQLIKNVTPVEDGARFDHAEKKALE